AVAAVVAGVLDGAGMRGVDARTAPGGQVDAVVEAARAVAAAALDGSRAVARAAPAGRGSRPARPDDRTSAASATTAAASATALVQAIGFLAGSACRFLGRLAAGLFGRLDARLVLRDGASGRVLESG